ncbi:CHASE2 domain-containing protein [Argonema antarcticum]|uniref:CHASE2 domain-containing protein n=1 Tax=Argonema antarcticum TaxID=2942763 RepID=UPI002013C06D|nr:CHASE2 domain-containing protein [Argonema antarcticum]MCL1473203.1 CHASE2 domain-containing protein [Argonema antarcticum A004/B2]
MNNYLYKVFHNFSIALPLQSLTRLKTQLKQLVWQWRGVTLVTSGVAGVTIGIRLLGWLQPIELAALDLRFRLRPQEPLDKRILIVSVEESDITRLKKWPCSDEILAQLLEKIKQQQPKAIGLDLYRNLPVETGYNRLAKVFKTTPNLIGIQKAIGDKYSSTIAPPPILAKLGQVSANDVVVDSDGVIRRAILFPMPEGNEGLPSLGLAVAMLYLKERGITPKADQNGFLQLGKTIFAPFEKNDGGYVRADAGGYQILLNFRGPARTFQTVSIMDVLDNRVPPDLIRDRIVLIGAKANSLNDVFYTPYSAGFSSSPVRTSGVEIQANIASQILSSVLDDRPLIQVWPKPVENLWILVWAGIIPVFAWKWRHDNGNFFIGKVTALVLGVGISILPISYLSFLAGWWIPVVSPLLALLASTIAIGCDIYVSKLQEMNAILEQTVKNLEQALEELQRSQLQLVNSEKMSALGQLVSGVAHEINNPIGFVSGNLTHMQEYVQDLSEHLKLYQEKFPNPGAEIEENATEIELEYTLEDLPNLVKSTQVGMNRIKEISVSLRTFSRSDTANKVACNIHDGIDSTLMILKHRLKPNSNGSEIKVIKEYGELPAVSCYLGQLNQVIMNLLSNAIDAFDELSQGRSLDEIKANPNMITIKTEMCEDNSMVAIRIKDNGPGIPESVQQKVFEQLFTTKGVGKGTGLGLSISRQIVEETHKGKLSCISAPGKGAEFIIQIPI